MDDKLIVLPSARAIRHRQLTTDNDTLFLPHYITMSDFIGKLCMVRDYKFLDEETRTLLLLEAADFQNFSKLQIERNFFTFTKNSRYIFKFFEELSAELYAIEDLSSADVYAEYEEHITILQELYKRYEKLCNEKKLLDRIFLPKLYDFHAAYLQNYSSVEVVLEGYLTNFELELLQKATSYCEVRLQFCATRFNVKMQTKLRELGFEIEAENDYLLDFNNKEIVHKEKRTQKALVVCENFSEEILQIAFIQQKIYAFVQKGYAPEKIAVILPNEQAASTIKSFDVKANLNFAMGESFRESTIYKKLQATVAYLDDATAQNKERLLRYNNAFYELLRPIYKQNVANIDFTQIMEIISLDIAAKADKKIFEEELYKFSRILPYLQEMNFRLALNLFMQRLSNRAIDDVRGGKVTVMGVLETRSIDFDAVILIDFDDKNVPKRSSKDMFLNTKLRETAGLPTMLERENLQKHYYAMLFSRSKEVAISYVSSEQNQPSRFLKELGIVSKNIYSETAYAEVLFARSKKIALREDVIVEPYSFKNVILSASRLKTYLTCKRKYYYHYVKQLKEHEIPRDMPQEHAIGTDVHKALENLYTKQAYYSDARTLHADLCRELDRVMGPSELECYLIAIQKRALERFAHNEIAAFNEGWRVKHLEKNFKTRFAGMQIQGTIDRIDMLENRVRVLDYKTGSYTLYNKNNFTQATDFQLEFYFLLAGELGNVETPAFYDLKESKIVAELFLEEKLALLEAHIADLLRIEEVDFERCEDTKACQYCAYALMCGRT